MEQVLTKALAFVIIIAFGYLLKQRGFSSRMTIN